MLKNFNLFLEQNGKVGSDQDDVFGYVTIEYFLESIKEEVFQDDITNMLH